MSQGEACAAPTSSRFGPIPAPKGGAWESDRLVYYLLLIFLVSVVLVPFGLLAVTSFQEPNDSAGGWTIQNWRIALSAAVNGKVVWNTIAIACVRTAISLPIAVAIAWLLARTNLPGRDSFLFMFWIAFFLPTLPVLQGWVLIFDREFGLLNHAVQAAFQTSEPAFDIFTWWGIVFGHLMTGTIAIKIMLLTPMFRNMDGALEEAASICGDRVAGALWRIVIPLMIPGIMLVALVGLIRALESFEVELFLGAPQRIDVYSTAIFRMLNREPALYGAATSMSMIILFIMVPLIIFHRKVTEKGRFETVTGRARAALVDLGRWKWPMFALVLVLSSTLAIFPIIFLSIGSVMRIFGWYHIPDAWTTEHWSVVFSDATFIDATRNTLTLGLGSAAIGIVLYPLIAYVAFRTQFWGRSIIDFLSWIPLALPGVILGLGLLLLFLSAPPLHYFYGTMLPLILAITIGNMTTGIQVTKASLANIGAELEEVAWSVGSSRLATLRNILVPLLVPVLLTVAILTFVASVRNVSYVALLSAGDTQPLAMLQLQFAVDGRYEASAVVGLVIVFLTIAISLAGRSLASRMTGKTF